MVSNEGVNSIKSLKEEIPVIPSMKTTKGFIIFNPIKKAISKSKSSSIFWNDDIILPQQWAPACDGSDAIFTIYPNCPVDLDFYQSPLSPTIFQDAVQSSCTCKHSENSGLVLAMTSEVRNLV